MDKEYEGVSYEWILCGISSLEIGEDLTRLLDIDPPEEEEEEDA